MQLIALISLTILASLFFMFDKGTEITLGNKKIDKPFMKFIILFIVIYIMVTIFQLAMTIVISTLVGFAILLL